jgi:hypothetical protein
VTLSDGETAHLNLYRRDIGLELIESGRREKIKLTPVAENSVGAVYKGKPCWFNPKEFVPEHFVHSET